MSTGNLIAFLRTVAARADLLVVLATKSKDEVIAAAADFGLWQTMWGQYYLEYIVNDLMTSLEEANLLPQARNS